MESEEERRSVDEQYALEGENGFADSPQKKEDGRRAGGRVVEKGEGFVPGVEKGRGRASQSESQPRGRHGD